MPALVLSQRVEGHVVGVSLRSGRAEHQAVLPPLHFLHLRMEKPIRQSGFEGSMSCYTHTRTFNHNETSQVSIEIYSSYFPLHLQLLLL